VVDVFTALKQNAQAMMAIENGPIGSRFKATRLGEPK